jgi:hypothetical protein
MRDSLCLGTHLHERGTVLGECSGAVPIDTLTILLEAKELDFEDTGQGELISEIGDVGQASMDSNRFGRRRSSNHAAASAAGVAPDAEWSARGQSAESEAGEQQSEERP